MLRIVIPGKEIYNNETNEFISLPDEIFEVEHSLHTISKWESKYMKPFISSIDKTLEETIDYIAMMCGKEYDIEAINRLSDESIKMISEYVNSKASATIIKETGKGSKEVVTSEIIYYWMVSYNIPFECQYWHLNRLMTLINVCNIKNSPPKKMGAKETMSRNTALNNARRKAMKTSG